MRTAVIVLAGVAFAGTILFLWALKRKRERIMADQDDINRAVEAIRSKDSVIQGAVLAFAALNARFKKAVAELAGADVDTTALNAAIAESEAASGELAKAIAESTNAADEVDGIGDDADTVVPEEVDTSEVVPVAETGQGGEEQQQGE